MPPHHPHEHLHPHLPHAHERMIEFEGDLSHADIDRLLRSLGEQLAQTGCLQLSDHKIPIPDPVKTLLFQERGPKGDLIVKFELKWYDGAANGAALPITDLFTRAGDERDALID